MATKEIQKTCTENTKKITRKCISQVIQKFENKPSEVKSALQKLSQKEK